MPENKSQREKTDASLTLERDKTNASISESRKGAEQQTDRNVEIHRDEADKKTSADRMAADATHEQSVEAKDKLHKERQSSDKKIERERDRADAAIEKEREKVKSDTLEFLKQERGETDKNLKTERAQTDASLSAEIKEHLKTKVSVTSRDDLIAILSHDLRNPIGNISSAADILAAESTQPELKTWISLIKRNAETSIHLIEDLFEMENIAQGKFELHLEKQNLFHALENSIESYASAAAEKHIKLELDPSFRDTEVFFDRGRILQVLSNILGNAVKFTPVNGTIRLALKVDSRTADITISDNGPGIAANQLEVIFNRFSQISSKDRKGLGLGLYISKIFVEAHKGKIWVDSVVGKGSTFHVSLDRSFGAK